MSKQFRGLLRLVFILTMVLVGGTTPVLAQDLVQTEEGVERQVVYDSSSSEDGFVSAPAGEAETVNGGTLMLIAYALLWLLVLSYVLVLARRARGAREAIDELGLQLRELDERLDELETGEAR